MRILHLGNKNKMIFKQNDFANLKYWNWYLHTAFIRKKIKLFRFNLDVYEMNLEHEGRQKLNWKYGLQNQ